MTSSPNKTILARRRRSKSALLRWLCYLAIALTVGSLMMIVCLLYTSRPRPLSPHDSLYKYNTTRYR